MKAEFDAAVDIANQILSVEPMHPIHHALIHIAASTETEGRALDPRQNAAIRRRPSATCGICRRISILPCCISRGGLAT